MHAVTSDTLLEALIGRTIGEESGYAMSALLSAQIPAGMIRYISAEIRNRLAGDLARAPHFARVASPTNGPDPVRDALLAHAAGQYIFTREEFLEMLGNATHFTENYLCRPRWTLASFLFVDQPAITTEMLLRKLEYIADYAYLPQLLRRMTTQRGRQVITSNECVVAIARIDDAVVREHSPRELALLARPIFEFYLLAREVQNTPIALRPLLLFLEDKQLAALRTYAEGVWHIRGKSEITIEEFVALNEDYATGRPPSAAEAESAEAPPANPAEAPATEQPPVIPEAEMTAPPVSAEEAPSQDITVRQDPTTAPAPEEIPRAAEPMQESLPFPDETPSDAQGVEPGTEEMQAVELPGETHSTPPEILPGQPEEVPPIPESPEEEVTLRPPSPTLEDMIPADLRRRFVTVICGRDAEFYDLVIARLNDIQSWSEAAAYIRELFEINNIDPFNETAVAFTDIVQRRCDRPGATDA